MNQKIYQMSFLIEAFDVLLQSQAIQTASFLDFCNQNKQGGSSKGKQKIIFLQKTLQNRNQQLIQFWSNDKRIELVFLLYNLHKDLTYLLKTTINIKNFELKFQFKPLNYNLSNFLRVSSSQRRILAEKGIYMLNKLRPKIFNLLKISVQSSLGIIKIQTPIYYNTIKDIFQLPKKVKSFICMFQSNLPNINQSLLNLIQISNQSPHKYAQELFLKTGHKLREVQKYLKLMNVVVNIGAEEVSQYQSFTKLSIIQQQSLSQLNKNIVKIQDQFNSKCLYYIEKEEMFNFADNKTKEEQLGLNEKERQKILNNLQISQISAMQQSNQRKFIVNHIRLVKPLHQIQLQKINWGGFSEIYKAEVYCKLEETVSEYGEMQKNQECIKKTMIIKSAKANFGQKIKHQKEILLKLTNAFAIFLPRYYFPPKQQTIQSFLFMQQIFTQIGSCSFEEFLKKCKSTLSLHTKMYFGLLISQGLRFLKDYKIVHLDLKPTNIMVGKKLDLKFIDFAESYHPSFKRHLPAQSMPYSSPEVYSKTDDFTFKSDVYSFGVTMHYLLTSKQPFYIYQRKQRPQAILSISDRWFFTPQALSEYGQTSIFPYILILIGKCIHQDPKCRPQLQWISLIFRQYLCFH